MDIQSVKLVCFSPTGTAKAIGQGILRGVGLETVSMFDITKPEARLSLLKTTEEDLLVVVVPVYRGRIPVLVNEWLCRISANRTPVACVVVYGNRDYENALLELGDILSNRGCIPLAGAAFIGEHSFSSTEKPIASGRPDAQDLTVAVSFGEKLISKVKALTDSAQLEGIQLPGAYPYGGMTELLNADFIAVAETCQQCGVCSEGCPVGAIDCENSGSINTEICLTCCSCIKSCPEKARTMKAGPVDDIATRLNRLFAENKDPVFFL